MAQSPFEHTVDATLKALGYQVDHALPIFDARAKRWRTGTTAPGRPDFVAVNTRLGWVFAIEVKGDRNYPNDDQRRWLRIWHSVPCAVAIVLRPRDDFNRFVEWLQTPWVAPSGFGWSPANEWVTKPPHHKQGALHYDRETASTMGDQT